MSNFLTFWEGLLFRQAFIDYLNSFLMNNDIKDYCPNGLQVEGRDKVAKVVCGVTASEALIDAAIDIKADTILVHHGYFWKGESPVVKGMKKTRLQKLLANDINLFAYHLPLDVHHSLGNNAQIGKLLGCSDIINHPFLEPAGIVMVGQLPNALSHAEFSHQLCTSFKPNNVTSVGNKSQIRRIAWCSGGGQNFIDDVAQLNYDGYEIDAYVSGEISEQTTHSAREQNIDYFAAGHHATERYGVKALALHLQDNTELDVRFIDIDNPA